MHQISEVTRTSR